MPPSGSFDQKGDVNFQKLEHIIVLSSYTLYNIPALKRLYSQSKKLTLLTKCHDTLPCLPHAYSNLYPNS